MKKTYNEVMAISNTLNAVSRQKTPFSVGIARNLKVLEPLIADYNVKREEIVDKYVKRDEEGNILGVKKPKVDEAGKPVLDDQQVQIIERVKEPQRIDETEWNDQDAFEKELKVLNEITIDLELKSIDVTKKYLDLATGKEITIEEYLDINFEAGLIIFLNDNGFFSGLDI